MEELGIGRPSTYASILAVLQEREYVTLEKKRLVAADKGRIVTAFLENFFKRYVEYDFTASLEEDLDRISNSEIAWKEVMRRFWLDFSAAIAGTKELRTAQVLDALNEALGPHIFPDKGDGTNPRACPSCGTGSLSLKLGKFGVFIGCSNYPECRFTRQLSAAGAANGKGANGEQGALANGVQALGKDEATGLEITLRDGRFGPYLQLGDGEKPKRVSLPKGLEPAAVDLEKAIEASRHCLARSQDTPRAASRSLWVLGATDLMCSTAGPSPISRSPTMFWRSAPTARSISSSRARPTAPVAAVSAAASPQAGSLASIPQGGPVTVRPGRFGPYVNHGKLNATLPKGRRSRHRRARRGACASRREGGRGRRREASEGKAHAGERRPCQERAAEKTDVKDCGAQNCRVKTDRRPRSEWQELGQEARVDRIQGLAQARLSSSARIVGCRDLGAALAHSGRVPSV